MHHVASAVVVFDSETTEFLAPEAMVKEGGQDCPVAPALEGIGRRSLQQRPGLDVADHRRFTFARVRSGALHTLDRVVGDGVFLAEVIVPCRAEVVRMSVIVPN